jgi:hypothetical protein
MEKTLSIDHLLFLQQSPDHGPEPGNISKEKGHSRLLHERPSGELIESPCPLTPETIPTYLTLAPEGKLR